MWKRIRHSIARAWLAGMLTWFPGGLVVGVVGVCMFSHAQSNLTPYSVSVRGYYRSDGTYVRPHRRRPPGSVAHDAPYGIMRLFSVPIFVAGLAATGIPIYRSKRLTDWELLPIVRYKSSLPNRPVDVRVPRDTAKARADWYCAWCSKHIRPRDTYYYYLAQGGRYSERVRFCQTCQVKLIHEHHEQTSRMAAYQQAVKKEKAMKRNLLIPQYKRYYGFEPLEGVDVPLCRAVAT